MFYAYKGNAKSARFQMESGALFSPKNLRNITVFLTFALPHGNGDSNGHAYHEVVAHARPVLFWFLWVLNIAYFSCFRQLPHKLRTNNPRRYRGFL